MTVTTPDDRAGAPRNSVNFRRLSTASAVLPPHAATAALTVDRIAGVGAPTPARRRDTAARATSVLFCAAPSAPYGIGNLRRLERLALDMGVRPQVLLRGTRDTARAARARGWTVLDATPLAILRLQPELAVIDDSSPLVATLWMRLARLFEIPVASVRDLDRRSPATPATDDLAVRCGWAPVDRWPADAAPASDDDDVPGRTLIALPGAEPALPWMLAPLVSSRPSLQVAGA